MVLVYSLSRSRTTDNLTGKNHKLILDVHWMIITSSMGKFVSKLGLREYTMGRELSILDFLELLHTFSRQKTAHYREQLVVELVLFSEVVLSES